jgi:flagellar FliJ protein
MAMFKFRLATLLKLREAARDERRAQLAQAYQADAILEEQQGQIAQSLADLQAEYRVASAPGEVNVDRLLAAQRHEMLLKAQRQQIQQQREAVAQEIERRRAVLAEANRDVKVLENLRERQLERYREEENRLDIRRLDEVAQQRAVREDRP